MLRTPAFKLCVALLWPLMIFVAALGLEPVWRGLPTLAVALVAALAAVPWSSLARAVRTRPAEARIASATAGHQETREESFATTSRRKAAEPPPPAPIAATGDHKLEPDAARPAFSVRVADDSLAGRLALGLMLSRAGYTVERSAADPDAFGQGGACDLVLLDVDLAADPLALCQRVRERVGEAHVVALTSDPHAWSEARLLEADVDRTLAKPVDAEALLELTAAFAEPFATSEHDDPARDLFVDHAALAALEKLADRAFVAEIVSQFSAEAALVLSSLTKAVAERDAAAFANQVHALRSSAANVGATGVYRLCLSWRETSAKELASTGFERLQRLQSEFARTCAALDAYVAASADDERAMEVAEAAPAPPLRQAG